MEIKSRLGVIEIEEGKIITFPKGIIGFESARTFCLVSRPEIEPYRWLQCVNQPELTWLVAPLLALRPDYHLGGHALEWEALKLTAGNPPLLLAIVTMNEDPGLSTMNLLAPIVINDQECLGGQIINEREGYRTRHLVKEELQCTAKEGENHAGSDAQEKAVADARG